MPEAEEPLVLEAEIYAYQSAGRNAADNDELEVRCLDGRLWG